MGTPGSPLDPPIGSPWTLWGPPQDPRGGGPGTPWIPWGPKGAEGNGTEINIRDTTGTMKLSMVLPYRRWFWLRMNTDRGLSTIPL